MNPRWYLLALLPFFVACADSSSDDDEPDACVPLFGIPSENTGLDDSECGPACGCPERTLTARTYSTTHIEALAQTTLLDPLALLASDPYADPAPTVEPGQVCGVLAETTTPGSYRLTTYASEEAAMTAGATITHHGPCGACSSLRDLSVYLATPDLTAPARVCGAKGLTEGDQAVLDCYAAMGFSETCAQMYFFNARNTRNNCLTPCLAALEDPYNLPDGSLNGCLQCDEDVSGAIFKALAGRSRRNSGLPSAVCRPCTDVPSVAHDYPDVLGG